MRYPSMWRTRTKAAREYYRAVEREQAEREAIVKRTMLLQDRSFLPKRIEGEHAYEAGRMRHMNPYPNGTGEFMHWDAGWRDAYQRQT